MAVINCDITREGVQVSESKRYAQEYSARYQIETDSEMGPIAVQSAARSVGPRSVPAKGDYYSVDSETDLSSFALDFKWSRSSQNKLIWYCDVAWRPLDPSRGESNIDDVINTNPLDMSPILWWEIEEYTKPIRKAKNITEMNHIGRPVGTDGPLVNAANEPFDILPEIPASRITLVIQMNWSSLDAIRLWNDTYANKLNDATYRGAAARTLLAKTISCSQPITDNGTTYYTVQIRLVYEPDTWKHVMVNAGMTYLPGTYNSGTDTWTPTDPPKPKTTDSDGAKIVSARMLTARGGLGDANTNTEVEYEYGVDEVDFTDIEVEPV